jgi:hypothetical protein
VRFDDGRSEEFALHDYDLYQDYLVTDLLTLDAGQAETVSRLGCSALAALLR